MFTKVRCPSATSGVCNLIRISWKLSKKFETQLKFPFFQIAFFLHELNSDHTAPASNATACGASNFQPALYSNEFFRYTLRLRTRVCFSLFHENTKIFCKRPENFLFSVSAQRRNKKILAWKIKLITLMLLIISYIGRRSENVFSRNK